DRGDRTDLERRELRPRQAQARGARAAARGRAARGQAHATQYGLLEAHGRDDGQEHGHGRSLAADLVTEVAAARAPPQVTAQRGAAQCPSAERRQLLADLLAGGL